MIRSPNLGLGAAVDLSLILWIAVRPSSPNTPERKRLGSVLDQPRPCRFCWVELGLDVRLHVQ